MHAVTLRIRVNDPSPVALATITDTLGECARELEAHEAGPRIFGTDPLGLVPDENDPGRYAWEIVSESYPV